MAALKGKIQTLKFPLQNQSGRVEKCGISLDKAHVYENHHRRWADEMRTNTEEKGKLIVPKEGKAAGCLVRWAADGNKAGLCEDYRDVPVAKTTASRNPHPGKGSRQISKARVFKNKYMRQPDMSEFLHGQSRGQYQES